jgi:hypothetical protein
MGNLVWLASYPKSGNTWVRAFLSNLLADQDQPVPINQLDKYSLHAADGQFYTRPDGQPASDLTHEELATLRPAAHRKLASSLKGDVFLKTHTFLGNVHGVPTITADVTAGAIYIVRNPLDVCDSLARHNGWSLDESIEFMGHDNAALETTQADQVAEPLRSWSSHVRSWTLEGEPGIMIVRYEDMIEDEYKVFSEMVRFLKFPASEENILKALRYSSMKELQAQEQEHGFNELPSEASGKFFGGSESTPEKKRLTKTQISRIVQSHREQMERFGYLPDS